MKLFTPLRVVVFLVLFSLLNIQTAKAVEQRPTHTDNYTCDNGTVFSITLIKEKGAKYPSRAELTLSGSKNVDTLACDYMPPCHAAPDGILLCQSDEYEFSKDNSGYIHLSKYGKDTKNPISFNTSPGGCHKTK